MIIMELIPSLQKKSIKIDSILTDLFSSDYKCDDQKSEISPFGKRFTAYLEKIEMS